MENAKKNKFALDLSLCKVLIPFKCPILLNDWHFMDNIEYLIPQYFSFAFLEHCFYIPIKLRSFFISNFNRYRCFFYLFSTTCVQLLPRYIIVLGPLQCIKFFSINQNTFITTLIEFINLFGLLFLLFGWLFFIVFLAT